MKKEKKTLNEEISEIKVTIKKLLKEANGLVKTDYPLCVQQFGEPYPYPTTSRHFPFRSTIAGKEIPMGSNFSDHYFTYDGEVQLPNGTKATYFCKGNLPVLGTKINAVKGQKPTIPDLGGQFIKLGSRGPLVRKIQNKLVKDGHGAAREVGGTDKCGQGEQFCDGKFGNGTLKAVKRFQTDALNMANPDGIVGDETYQQMFMGTAMTK